jgi:hypothetical protein
MNKTRLLSEVRMGTHYHDADKASTLYVFQMPFTEWVAYDRKTTIQ